MTVIAAGSAPQPVILPPERMPTDMTHRHIEAVDLTQDDDDEAAPLTLTEEKWSAPRSGGTLRFIAWLWAAPCRRNSNR
jgi:hypothetical protein